MPTSSGKKSGSRRDSLAEALLEEPPWSRVHKVQLIRREIREYLSSSAIELLLSAAEYVVEGGAELERREGTPNRSADPQTPVYASLMTTIDLAVASVAFREPADAATAQRVAELMEEHDVVRQKLTGRAKTAVAELIGVEPAALEISLDYEVRAEGNKVFLDADVEAQITTAPSDQSMGSPGRRRRS